MIATAATTAVRRDIRVSARPIYGFDGGAIQFKTQANSFSPARELLTANTISEICLSAGSHSCVLHARSEHLDTSRRRTEHARRSVSLPSRDR